MRRGAPSRAARSPSIFFLMVVSSLTHSVFSSSLSAKKRISDSPNSVSNPKLCLFSVWCVAASEHAHAAHTGPHTHTQKKAGKEERTGVVGYGSRDEVFELERGAELEVLLCGQRPFPLQRRQSAACTHPTLSAASCACVVRVCRAYQCS